MGEEVKLLQLGEVLKNCGLVLPELVLIAGILVVILFELFLRAEKSYLAAVPALVALLVSLHLLLSKFPAVVAQSGFWGMIYFDKFGFYFKFIFLLSAFLVALFSLQSRELKGHKQGEYYALLLGATLGMCLLVSARNLVMFYLALETLSLCCYVLAGYLKKQLFSTEAAVKYVIYGAATSGIMLFGLSFLFGLTGSLDIPEIFARLRMGTPMSLFALLLVLVGIGFKLAMVPFQFWAPDVYQGAPTPITAYLSVASKVAGFGALFRIFLPLFRDALPTLSAGRPLLGSPELLWLFWILSVATMTFGNLVALRQRDIKRLFAYSSIAHCGYLLMPMTIMTRAALETMLFYFIIYLFMNLGAFYLIVVLVNKTGSQRIEDYAGIIRFYPFLVGCLAVILFSLVGMPPTGGFIAKFHVFRVVVEQGMSSGRGWFYFSLAMLGVANSVVSLYYYMYVLKTMVLDHGLTLYREEWKPVESLVTLVLVVPLLYFGIFWQGLYELVISSIKGLLV